MTVISYAVFCLKKKKCDPRNPAPPVTIPRKAASSMVCVGQFQLSPAYRVELRCPAWVSQVLADFVDPQRSVEPAARTPRAISGLSCREGWLLADDPSRPV